MNNLVLRDIELDIDKLNNNYLYNINDLYEIAQHNIEQQKMEAVQKILLIDKESAYFIEWLHSQSSINTICDYSSQAEKIMAKILEKALCFSGKWCR
ncbi:MAG: hypothetical protein ACTS77_03870 [Arsenophonus sp. NC-TX2-MAG3]